MAVHHHARAVAHQEDVYARLVHLRGAAGPPGMFLSRWEARAAAWNC